ncbi:MAG: prepilin peptidase [Oscillospiraceae bacterium]
MDILISSIIVIVLSIAGYVYSMVTFKSEATLKNIKSYLPNSFKTISLLVAPMLVGALIIILFKVFHEVPLISATKLLILIMILFPIAFSDYKNHTVPNKILLVALGARIIIYGIEFIISVPKAVEVLKYDLLGAVIIGVFFLLCLLLFKNSIGMGDVKLFFIMGLYQGLWGCVNSIFWSLIASFFVSVGLLISKKKNKKDAIPFCPSILVGTIFAIAMSGM